MNTDIQKEPMGPKLPEAIAQVAYFQKLLKRYKRLDYRANIQSWIDYWTAEVSRLSNLALEQKEAEGA